MKYINDERTIDHVDFTGYVHFSVELNLWAIQDLFFEISLCWTVLFARLFHFHSY